jgi:hypothetical protein
MGEWAGTAAGTNSLTVAAAGTDLATATPLVNGLNLVATGTASTADGVRLPAGAAVGDVVAVFNTVNAVPVDVWPATSAGKINDGSAGAAVTLAANFGCLFISLGSENWFRVGHLSA